MQDLIDQQQRDKSVVISVRIPQTVKQELERESDVSGISLNTLIAQVLLKHVKWDAFATEIGFASLPKSFIKAVIEKIDDESLTTLSSSVGRRSLRDAMIFMHGEVTINSFVSALDLWLEAANIQYRRKERNGQTQYMIMHKLGTKWSLYLNSVVNSLLNELGYKTAELNTDEESLSFTIIRVN